MEEKNNMPITDFLLHVVSGVLTHGLESNQAPSRAESYDESITDVSTISDMFSCQSHSD